MSVLDIFQKRRSQYALTNQLPITVPHLQQLIAQCIKQAPSAFNMQSARVVLLLADKHRQLWHLTSKILRDQVPLSQQAHTCAKINSFAAAYGTILYFEDQPVVQQMQEQFSLYKDNFPVWAQQANGMLQFAIWCALAEQNIGASLQHYNPLIDEAVARTFDIPVEWQLVAQMPFGQILSPAASKTFVPMEKRFWVKQ